MTSWPAAYEPALRPRWTLATYNVQDLFDTADDPHAQDVRVTENQLQNKMVRLARVLHILNADIVGLMEVETRGVLERLNETYLADLNYQSVILIEGNDPERGIDVALLSRFPVTQTRSHAQDLVTLPNRPPRRVFSRDCLECHVTLPSQETLVLLVNHFKSKRGGEEETEPLRHAQATRVSAIAHGLMRVFPLVAVVGDLNDDPVSSTLQLLTAGATLADVAEDVTLTHRFTFVHAGQPERIDYLLASPALAARLEPGSVLIPHDTWAARASDHAPIRATFGAGTLLGPNRNGNLTVAYDASFPPVTHGQGTMRINASRFFASDLNRLAGQTVIVTGPVHRVEETRGTGVLRLFLGHSDPERAFRVVVFPKERAALFGGDLASVIHLYSGQMVQVVGPLHFYQGHPEIQVQGVHQFRRVVTEPRNA